MSSNVSASLIINPCCGSSYVVLRFSQFMSWLACKKSRLQVQQSVHFQTILTLTLNIWNMSNTGANQQDHSVGMFLRSAPLVDVMLQWEHILATAIT